MTNLIIILLVLIFAGLVFYRAVKEQIPEPKKFSKEEIKKRPGSYFDRKEI